MSLCFRTLPNKFTSFVNTRKQVTKIDRQLPKHIKSSPFLEEFLGTQGTPSSTVSFKEKSVHTLALSENLQKNSLDSVGELSEVLNKPCNWNQEQAAWSRLGSTHVTSNVDFNEHEGLITKKITIDNNVRWTEPFLKYNDFTKGNINVSLMIHDAEKSIDRMFHAVHVRSSFEGHTLLIDGTEINKQEQEQGSKETRSNRPTEQQLQHVYDVLCANLPHLFSKPTDYRIYSQDLIFVNNIKKTVTHGLPKYIMQVSTLKCLGHLKYAHVKFDILKITIHPEDDSIKVRWRISGITTLRIVFSFWKLKPWDLKGTLNLRESWHDGFSTFYVNSDGLVYKHVVDKMMPDQEMLKKDKPAVATKLALLAALVGIDSCSYNEIPSELISLLQLPRIK